MTEQLNNNTMEQFIPDSRSSTSYTGFNLNKTNLYFSKGVLEKMLRLSPVSLFFIKETNVVKFVGGGTINVKTDGRLACGTKTLPVERGRYLLISENENEITFIKK